MAEPLIVSEVVVFVVPWSSQYHSIVSENHVYAVLHYVKSGALTKAVNMAL